MNDPFSIMKTTLAAHVNWREKDAEVRQAFFELFDQVGTEFNESGYERSDLVDDLVENLADSMWNTDIDDEISDENKKEAAIEKEEAVEEAIEALTIEEATTEEKETTTSELTEDDFEDLLHDPDLAPPE